MAENEQKLMEIAMKAANMSQSELAANKKAVDAERRNQSPSPFQMPPNG